MPRTNRRTPIFASVHPSDLGRELIRADVQEAVGGALAALNSDNVIIRALAASGQMDARFTSSPVRLGAL